AAADRRARGTAWGAAVGLLRRLACAGNHRRPRRRRWAGSAQVGTAGLGPASGRGPFCLPRPDHSPRGDRPPAPRPPLTAARRFGRGTGGLGDRSRLGLAWNRGRRRRFGLRTHWLAITLGITGQQRDERNRRQPEGALNQPGSED